MDNDAQGGTGISVIIAAYNVQSYIERAVRSALDQSGIATEVIVVDDASTDGTAERVARMDDPRIKLLRRAQNGGPAAARNDGLAAAAFPWIAILDGDDTFLPGRLSRLLAHARTASADIVVDNLEIYDEVQSPSPWEGGRGGVIANILRELADSSQILLADPPPHLPPRGEGLFCARRVMFRPKDFGDKPTLDLATFIKGNLSFLGSTSLGYVKPIFSASFLQKHGLRYDSDIRIGEDYMLLAEALALGAHCAIETVPGYAYTVRKGSTSYRLDVDDIERMMRGDQKFLSRHALDTAARRAQNWRRFSLNEALAFTKLVDAIKQKNFFPALKIILRRPSAVFHLWRPAWARIERLFKRTPNENIQSLLREKTVLLFYKEYEADKFFKYDRYLKRILRPLYQLFHHRQKKTGFAVSFDLMRRALSKSGYKVIINNRRLARNNPAYPVGLVGFPVLLEGWNLPNPALLGPSLYDHPLLAPRLFDNPAYRKYVALAPWTKNMYAPVYGEDKCFCWFAGLDLGEWPDLSAHPKTYDFLIYDKIRWDHDYYQKELIDPIVRALEARGLTYCMMRYKMHDHETFRRMLSGARGFLFLCEHETQGLAYQEAMASGVPVLAWDRGYWADPLWKKFTPEPPLASSVPFFSNECGETFKAVENFDSALERFTAKRASCRPRDYVARALDPAQSAKIYAGQYFSLMDRQ